METIGNTVDFTEFTALGAVLSKRYSVDETGKVIKQAAAQMSKGTARRVAIPFADLPEFLNRSGHHNALGWGTFADDLPDVVRVTTSGRENLKRGVIARNKACMTYKAHASGVFMGDHDPSEFGVILSSGELIAVIGGIHPEFLKAARVVRGSVSAGVNRIGELLSTTGKGFHFYIPVKDASDIPRYTAILFKRLWLAGYGFIALAKNGALLIRAVIDPLVGSPERLDFTAPPIIESDLLCYTPPETIYTPGVFLDTSTLPDLTDDELIEFAALVMAAKDAIRPRQIKVEKAHKKEYVKKQVAQGVSKKDAVSAYDRMKFKSFAELDSNFVLYFGGKAVTVNEVLADPHKYDEKACSDPIEGPDYGLTTAMFFWNDGKPVVHSLAHGMDKSYFLKGGVA